MKSSLSLLFIALVALAAFAREADRKIALGAGYDDQLATPVDVAALLAKVQETADLA